MSIKNFEKVLGMKTLLEDGALLSLEINRRQITLVS